jgi:hypothetical protein
VIVIIRSVPISKSVARQPWHATGIYWSFIGVNAGLLLALSIFLFHTTEFAFYSICGRSFHSRRGIGNLIDRTFNNGFVTDFINAGIGPLRTGIFNVQTSPSRLAPSLLSWLYSIGRGWNNRIYRNRWTSRLEIKSLSGSPGFSATPALYTAGACPLGQTHLSLTQWPV